MNRKLFVILALAALMAVLWCGTVPAASGYAFTEQPSSVLQGSDCTFIISWQTNFVPVKVEIKAYTHDSVEDVETITDSADLKRAMSWPIPMHRYSNDAYYRVIAYYDGTGSSDCARSAAFEPDWDSVRFTQQPSGGYLYYYQDFKIGYRTSFSPKKVTVHMGGRSYTDETPLYGYTFVPLSSAREGYSFMEAYYGDGPSDYISSAGFEVDWDSVGFSQPPTVRINDKGTAFEVGWWTGFVPEYVRLWKHTPADGEVLDEIREDMGHQMSYELPFTHDSSDDYYYIYAYSDYFSDHSDHFAKDFSLLDFTSQPSSGSVPLLGRYSIQWTTTYKPTEVVIGYMNDSNQFVRMIEITQNLGRTMRYDLSYQECNNRPLMIRAYYNSENNFKQSEPFTVTRDQTGYGFLGDLPDITIEPGQVKTIAWNTNFVPMYVTIGMKDSNNNFFPMATIIKATMSASMSYDLKWADAQTCTMYVRAYNGVNSYLESTFHLEKVPARFLTSPQSGTIHLNETYTLAWSTAFLPKRVEVVKDDGTKLKTITNGLKKSMTCNVQPSELSGSGTYNVKAYYTIGAHFWEDEYVYSSPFKLTSVAGDFTKQPTGGTVYPWTSRQLSWTTNFIPTRVEIGCNENNTWTPVETLNSGLRNSMTHVLEYDQSYSSEAWSIRAYYGDQDEYIPSRVFAVNKQPAYVCGDTLTATFADGTLTISGTGAMYDYSSGSLPPWYGIRSQITKVVIGNSVTSIGRNAFYCCSSLRYVYYDGFRSQWDAIDVGSGNTDLRNASVRYLYRSGTVPGATAGTIYWNIYGGMEKLTVSGNGYLPDGQMPWYEYAQHLKEIEIQYTVKGIGEENFRGCTAAAVVRLPGCLSWVKTNAFRDSTALTDVYFEGLQADWNRMTRQSGNEPLASAALHTQAIYDGLTGDLSWSLNDEGLLTVFFDDSNMGDGEDTDIPDFDGRSQNPAPWDQYYDQIKAIRVDGGVTRIGAEAFINLNQARTLSIADTVTSIGEDAFAGCSRLEDFILPDSVTTIEAHAFRGCHSLEFLTLPDSIETIYVGAYENCTNLEVVHLPSGLRVIDDECFRNCGLIDRIYIPSTVEYIGVDAFAGCETLPDSFSHVYYEGASAQWKAIDVDSGNDCLTGAGNIHMTPEELRIDEANFPDAEFRGYIGSTSDLDRSGWLTDEEIASTLVILCGAIEAESLTGIEYFSALEELYCTDNLLTELDLSAGTALAYLDCSWNSLTALPLDTIPGLYHLDCAGNQLTALDVSMEQLEYLYCQSNPLDSLNLGAQAMLQTLSCYATDLAVLDLRGCPQLLNCVYNGTKTVTADYVEYKLDSAHLLRVGSDTELILLDTVPVDEARFPDDAFRAYVSAHFDTNGSGWLSDQEIALAGEINAYEYQAGGFDSLEGIEVFTGLSYLSFSDCPNLTGIDLSANTKITDIDIWDTGLTTLDVHGMALGFCSIARSPLTTLTLGEQPSLFLLACTGTNLTSLDVTGCPLLLDAIANGVRTEKNGCVTYAGDSSELTLDADVQLITGLTLHVTFDARGGSAVDTQGVAFGEPASEPADPVKIGAVFTGWYADPSCSADVLYDFTTPVMTKLTLYAGWLVPEPNGILRLPAMLTGIEDQAFSGIAAEAVIIPGTVVSISGNPFAGSSVRYVYGLIGSAAETVAAATDGLTFVPIDDAWLASR